ncbi:MAG: hypothetical protein ABIJ15_08140 [bacterium]
MKKKGLCASCENSETCTFPNKDPVYFCDEFNLTPRPACKRVSKSKKKKSKK